MIKDSLSLSNNFDNIDIKGYLNHENNYLFPYSNNYISSELNSLNESEMMPKDDLSLNNYICLKISSFENDYKYKHNEIQSETNSIEEKFINNKYHLLLKKNYFSIIKNKKIKENQLSNDDFLQKTKLKIVRKKNSNIGRKRKNEFNLSGHTKYSNDNLRNKSRTLVLNYTLKFLNEKIKNIYKGNIGHGVTEKKLLPISIFCKKYLSIESNKIFIDKTLGEIFSGEISRKFSNYLSNHNGKLIKRLLNEQDENKRLLFQKLFEIKFLQCIETFSGNNTYEELEGFIKFNQIKHTLKDDQEYIDKLELFLINYKESLVNKKFKKNLIKSN